MPIGSKARRMPADVNGISPRWRKKSTTLVRLLMAIGFFIALTSPLMPAELARAHETDGSTRSLIKEGTETETEAPLEQQSAARQISPDQAASSDSSGQTGDSNEVDDNLVPVYLSERKLRSSIVNLNEDLRQLKRDFIEDATRIYLRVGQNPKVGREKAKRGRVAAVAAHLAGEQFAQILIKKHIAERRLLSGLKAAFVKLLPLATIKRLMAKFSSYRWLRGAHHYDLRPRFEGADQLQLVRIYEILELRARLRAADDVLTLTSSHIKRILNVAQEFLIENRYSIDSTAAELQALAELLPQMLDFYLNQVVYARTNLAKAYEDKLICMGDITAMVGGEEDFLKLGDELIDSIGLDIDLNQEARSLGLPPTINEEIVANIERKWIPRKLLDSIKEERELLLKHRRHTKRFLEFDEDKYDDDLANWIYQMVETIADKSYN